MKRILTFIIISLITISSAIDLDTSGNFESSQFSGNITTQLSEKMNISYEEEFIRVNISLADDYDSQKMISETSQMVKQDKRDHVTSTLKEFSTRTQADLISQLNELESVSKVRKIKALWLVNIVNCEITKSAIEILSLRSDILSIDYDEERNILLKPTMDKNSKESLHEMRDGREITWNVIKVNADDVWAQGYYGAGILVAVLDSGVNYNHTDLNDHLWTHPDYPYYGYDFANDDNNPMDDNGHGTHCAGTVAGDGTSGSQTGMAPEATIMCLKLIDSGGNAVESNCWQAIEFAVDYGADVLSMSFGWQHSWGPDRTAWRNVMDYAYAADIFAAVAAGNEGEQQSTYPIPDNVRTPGDCPPPWLHPDQTLTGGLSSVVCIGATDSNDNLANFSGRGPVTWEFISGYNDYAYNPEQGLIRPDISAPGVNIKSLAHYNNTGYESGWSWSGTSMATPCVAGVIALMLSKNYTLTPAQLDQTIEENVAVAQNPKNNNFGSGRIDALASINAVSEPNTPPNAAINPNPADDALYISINTNLSWMNGGGATTYEVYFGTDNPPTNIVNGEVVSNSSYELTGELDFETTYYWNINSINAFGNAEGPIWSFTTGGPADEDFETGDFSLYPWTFAGNQDWIVQTSQVYEGTYSAKSGSITHNQTTELQVVIDVEDAGQISFYTKISCEDDSNDDWDYLAFYIDGTEQDRWDGEVAWSYQSYDVAAGNRTFKWKYLKDGIVSTGSDCAWLDYITFPGVPVLLPDLVIIPEEFIFDLVTNEIVTDELTIENVGSAVGEYTIELIYTGDWLELDSYSGTVQPGDTDIIELTIDPAGLENGDYTCDISITDNINITIIPVTLSIAFTGADSNLLSVTTLIGNYPNPFNPTTTISFTTTKSTENTELAIYNLKGQKVRTLVNKKLDAGSHQVVWDGKDVNDRIVSSGIYFYKVKTGNFEQTKKMILMK